MTPDLVEAVRRAVDALPLGAIISDFRDGLVGEVRYFPTWQDALKAAALEQ